MKRGIWGKSPIRNGQLLFWPFWTVSGLAVTPGITTATNSEEGRAKRWKRANATPPGARPASVFPVMKEVSSCGSLLQIGFL